MSAIVKEGTDAVKAKLLAIVVIGDSSKATVPELFTLRLLDRSRLPAVPRLERNGIRSTSTDKHALTVHRNSDNLLSAIKLAKVAIDVDRLRLGVRLVEREGRQRAGTTKGKDLVRVRVERDTRVARTLATVAILVRPCFNVLAVWANLGHSRHTKSKGDVRVTVTVLSRLHHTKGAAARLPLKLILHALQVHTPLRLALFRKRKLEAVERAGAVVLLVRAEVKRVRVLGHSKETLRVVVRQERETRHLLLTITARRNAVDFHIKVRLALVVPHLNHTLPQVRLVKKLTSAVVDRVLRSEVLYMDIDRVRQASRDADRVGTKEGYDSRDKRSGLHSVVEGWKDTAWRRSAGF